MALSILAILAVFVATALGIRESRRQKGLPGLEDLQRLSVAGEVLLSPVVDPKASTLYYASNRGGGRLRIWRQSPDGANAQVLSSEAWDAFDIDLSPDGAWLTYWSAREGGGVYLQSVNGAGERLVASHGRSPRFSADGKQILYWVREPHTGFGRSYTRSLPLEKYEPEPVAGEFADAHNPQWTPDGRVLLCGTLRTNDKEAEHDFWVVPARGHKPPVKTGIFEYLRNRGVHPDLRAVPTTSFRWFGNDLIFAAREEHQTRVYRLPLKPGQWTRSGDLRLLAKDTDSLESPSVSGSLLAVTSSESNVNIWGIPLAGGGTASGQAHRLTEGAGDEFYPSLSMDGRLLVYMAWRPPDWQIWRKDLTTGLESELFHSPSVSRLRLAPDGSAAFFRVMEGPFPQEQQIHRMDLVQGQVRRVCADCGDPTSVGRSGEFVLHQTGSRLSRLAVLHVPTGERRECLRHPHHSVESGRLSPDGSWVAFTLNAGPDGGRLYIAPFRGLAEIGASEWIPVSDPAYSSFEPAWSPDGQVLYFLSDRDGSRDLWLQRLDSRKHATGNARLVYAFRDPKLTPLKYHLRSPAYVGLSIGPTQAVLALNEWSSRILTGRMN